MSRGTEELIVAVRPAERQDCADIYNLSCAQLSTIQSTATESENQPAARDGDDEQRQRPLRPPPRLMSAKELEHDGFDTIPPLFHCLVATRATATTASTAQEQQKMKNNDGADEKSHNYSHSHSQTHDLASSSPSTSTSRISIVVGYALYFISYPVWEGKAIQLVNLCVDPTYESADREQIGAALLRELAKVAIDGGFADIRLECQYGNTANVKLLEQNLGQDFTAKEGWNSFQIDENGLQRLIRP